MTRIMSLPAFLNGLDDRRLRKLVVLALFGKSGRLVHFAANDVARDDDHDAREEGDPPAPRIERLRIHVVRERQEYRRGEDLPGLHALQREACEKAAPAERSVLENHRARAGNLPGHGEALDQPEENQKQRRPPAHLRVRRQQPDAHRRNAHEEHAHDQHRLAAMGVTPVPEEEGADRPRDVAHAVGRERRDDGDRGVALGKEELREDQRRRRGVDEEVVILQRRADPAAGRRLLGLVPFRVAHVPSR